MSLLETVQVAHVHSQSERVLPWLLIVLSLFLLASAVAECFLEVRECRKLIVGWCLAFSVLFLCFIFSSAKAAD